MANEREDGKNLLDFYMYISKKKRKNRSHREKALKHIKDCKTCVKGKYTKFFSYQITPVLIEILKEKRI